MKRTILTATACIIMLAAGAQTLTKTKVLKSADFGNQKITAAITDGDTIYAVLIATSNRYQKNIVCGLGHRDEALRLLNYLYEADLKKGDILELKNETNNIVTKNPLGGLLVYSEGRQFSGQLRKPNIKSFIKAVRIFCGLEVEEEDNTDERYGGRDE